MKQIKVYDTEAEVYGLADGDSVWVDATITVSDEDAAYIRDAFERYENAQRMIYDAVQAVTS